MKSHNRPPAALLPFLLIPALMAGLASANARAATLVVTSAADPGVGGCTAAGAGDGCTLREAILAANNQTLTPGDDTINATGISGIISLASALPALNTNIVLNGPGAANLTVQRSSVAGTAAFRIFAIDNGTTTGPTVVLSGFTITKGFLTGAPGAANSGGGIYNNHGTLTVNNCIVKSNTASMGGGIANNGSQSVNATLVLNNCKVLSNTASQDGGGLFNNGSGGGSAPLAISGGTFTGNSAANGAAILNDGHAGGSATITELSNSTLSGNTASSNGGAIENDGRAGGSATLVISYATVSGNHAVNGGAIDNNGVGGSATQALSFSTFSGNSASGNGGAINNIGGSAGSATMHAGTSTFTANSAALKGGVVNNDGQGGSATVEMDSCTLKTNTEASTSASLDSNGTGGSATLALGSTILSNGTAKNILLAANSATTFTSKNHNLSSDAAGGDGTTAPGGPYLTAGGDIRNADPKLGALQNNGGPTQTVALLAGSPAIDKGLSNATTDQRGFGFNGIVDIGAFEFEGITSSPTVLAATVTSPATASILRALQSASGTVTDKTGGPGLAKVEVTLQRVSDSKYWNAGVWVATATPLSTTLRGDGTWIKTNFPPAGPNANTQIQEGKYILAATATDKAGKTSTVTTASKSTFTIDTTAPSVTITEPAAGSTLKTLARITGTASDNFRVGQVLLALKRNSDGQYWSGTAWGAYTTLTTDITGLPTQRTWARSTGLPTGANLTYGSYVVTAIAIDSAGNRSSLLRSFSVSETLLPTGVVISPANASTVSSLPQVAGTAADTGGSGLAAVRLTLQRLSDAKFWTGAAWSVNSTNLLVNTTLVNPNSATWTCTAMPGGANLADGAYRAVAVALDKAGNTRTFQSQFALRRTAAISAPAVKLSNVALSSASASTGGAVQLVFSGALAGSATDVTRYNATQNGTPVEVLSARQKSPSVIVLTTDSLVAGAPVALTYDLQDTAGGSVGGTASVTPR